MKASESKIITDIVSVARSVSSNEIDFLQMQEQLFLKLALTHKHDIAFKSRLMKLIKELNDRENKILGAV